VSATGGSRRSGRRRSTIRRGGLALGALLFLVPGLVAGCGIGEPDEAHTLNILAGSELKDLEPMLPDLQRATGVKLVPTYIGTLEGAERIVAGDPSDAAWFSHGKYLSLLPGAGSKIVASERIMLSPVVIGVKRSVADRFGWTGNPNVTWKDIEARAADGSFHFAMTNPAASNSGFTALIGVASALSGSSDAIDTGTIDVDALRAFFRGQTLTAGSSGFLADAYVRDQDRLDGLINYESILMQLNAGGKLHESLTLIYPREGIVTADYPFMLLNGAKREAYDKVVAWLRRPEIQRRIMTDTLRRPAVPGIALDPRFPTDTLIELPFPSKLETIDALLTAYLDQIRRPASAVFVLDVSGSMAGDRIAALKRALNTLTGTDTSLTGRFARFRTREQVTFITFSDQVADQRNFTIDDSQPGSSDMTAIRSYVDSLSTLGGTAIYDALDQAYTRIAQDQAADPNRLYSIVLMTDGENNRGSSYGDFKAAYSRLPDAVRSVHVYPILFGEANKDEMGSLADLTGGRTFDATGGGLDAIFKQIRGYQ
jgi:Ca-activated chloride channel family protein